MNSLTDGMGLSIVNLSDPGKSKDNIYDVDATLSKMECTVLQTMSA
jgi:hypothetical protein